MILERNRKYTPNEILSIPPSFEYDRIDRQKLYEAHKVAALSTAMLQIQSEIDSVEINLGERHEILPDVQVTISQPESKKVIEYEVVSFTPHSTNEGLIRFLKRTKLHPKCAYPDQTVILCCVEAKVEDPANTAERIANVLSTQKHKHNITMLFEVDEESMFICDVYPEYQAYGYIMKEQMEVKNLNE